MMKLNLLSIFTLCLFASCSTSNLSKNIVQDSTILIKNGTYSDKVWNENLEFKRTSWFHELTLQLDLLMTQVAPHSSFNLWFSKSELEEMLKCGEAKIMLAYTLDTKDIPYSMIFEQLEKNGYSHFEIPDFKKQLTQHPDAAMLGLRLYKIFAICKKTEDQKPLTLNFPGYPEKRTK